MSYATCQRAAKRANLHAYRVIAVHLKASDLENTERRVEMCLAETGDHFSISCNAFDYTYF